MASQHSDSKAAILQRMRAVFRPRSFSRYMIVGGLNTAAGLAGFPILYWALGAVVSVNGLLVANWILNNLIGFILHKTITFQSTSTSYKQMPKFFALSIIGLVVNVTFMDLVLHFFKFNPILVLYASTFLLAVTFMLLNYFGMDRLIFRRDDI